MKLSIEINTVRGFLDPEEGARLYNLALEASAFGPCLEVGSYCGKSTMYLGTGVLDGGGLLYAIDHHRGSEEHQQGEEYHDPELYDEELGRMDSLPEFRRNIARAGLEDHVVPVVTSSANAGLFWKTPLALVFIDGGHSEAAALTDYHTWSPHVMPGGYLAIHDLFPNPEDGGQAPYNIYKLAMASGDYEECEWTKTLGVLRKQRVGGR